MSIEKNTDEVEKAYAIIQAQKKQNEENFTKELQELCKKYNINLGSQIVIQAM